MLYGTITLHPLIKYFTQFTLIYSLDLQPLYLDSEGFGEVSSNPAWKQAVQNKRNTFMFFYWNIFLIKSCVNFNYADEKHLGGH